MSLMLHLSLGQAKRDGRVFSQMTKLADLRTVRSYKDLVATPVANKVPTATFTELVIQDQSDMCRRSIVTTLGNTDAVSASDRICMSTVYYFLASIRLSIKLRYYRDASRMTGSFLWGLGTLR